MQLTTILSPHQEPLFTRTTRATHHRRALDPIDPIASLSFLSCTGVDLCSSFDDLCSFPPKTDAQATFAQCALSPRPSSKRCQLLAESLDSTGSPHGQTSVIP